MSHEMPKAFAAAMVAASFWTYGPAFAADPIVDPMHSWSGPTASAPSQGALDIMRQAECGPSVSRRLGLLQVSGPLQLELQTDRIFLDSRGLSAPPRRESAERPLPRAR